MHLCDLRDLLGQPRAPDRAWPAGSWNTKPMSLPFAGGCEIRASGSRLRSMCRGWQQAGDCQRQRAFAGAAFADDGDALALADGRNRCRASASERRRGCSARASLRYRAAASRQAPARSARIRPGLRRTGSTPSTVTTSARPGMIDRNGAVRSTARPFSDHAAPGDAVRIAKAEEGQRSLDQHGAGDDDRLQRQHGGKALGSISRNAISAGCMPMTRAPATKSRSRIDRISARTMRAGRGPRTEGDRQHDDAERGADHADEGQRQEESRARSGRHR